MLGFAAVVVTAAVGRGQSAYYGNCAQATPGCAQDCYFDGGQGGWVEKIAVVYSKCITSNLEEDNGKNCHETGGVVCAHATIYPTGEDCDYETDGGVEFDSTTVGANINTSDGCGITV